MTDEENNKERLELALEAAGLDLWENDLVTGEVTRRAIKTFAELGYDEAESLHYMDDMFLIVHPDDIHAVKTAIKDHLEGGTPQYRCEFRLRRKDGAWVWYANYGKIMDRTGANRGRRFVGVTFNINDRKQREHEIELANRKLAEQNTQLENMNALLQSMATTDPLTHLPNRRLLLDRIQHALAASARNGKLGALLFIDLDNFKPLNDTHGHNVGDALLQQVAQRLVTCVREEDTVARMGGDEFVVMLEDMSHQRDEALAQAQNVGNKILAALNRPYRIRKRELHNTPSIGVSLFSGQRHDADELLKQADAAMYRAKKTGRNMLCFFDAKTPDEAHAERLLATSHAPDETTPDTALSTPKPHPAQRPPTVQAD